MRYDKTPTDRALDVGMLVVVLRRERTPLDFDYLVVRILRSGNRQSKELAIPGHAANQMLREWSAATDCYTCTAPSCVFSLFCPRLRGLGRVDTHLSYAVHGGYLAVDEGERKL